MKLSIFITLIITILFTGCFKEDGQIRITSDVENAIIYIDGDKKGMTGDGYTTIIIAEGDHKVRIFKKKNEEWFYEGTQDVFVGANSSIKINIHASTKPTKYRIERLVREKKAEEERLAREKKKREKQLAITKKSLIFNNDLKKIIYKDAKKKALLLNTNSCVQSYNNELILNQCQTDNGPTAILKLNHINPNNPIIIERDVFIHPHYSRKYEGGDIFFTGGLSLADIDDASLVDIHYFKYKYNCNCNYFWIGTKTNKVNPIWNKWFKETIIYFPNNGKVDYYINNHLKLQVNAKTTISNSIKISINTYGWWTGHYTKMKNFKVYHFNGNVQ